MLDPKNSKPAWTQCETISEENNKAQFTIVKIQTQPSYLSVNK